jgi:hypothetical protein
MSSFTAGYDMLLVRETRDLYAGSRPQAYRLPGSRVAARPRLLKIKIFTLPDRHVP